MSIDQGIFSGGSGRRRCRKRRSWVATSLALILVAVPSLGSASDEDPFDRPGLYAGLSGVYQRNVFENRLEDLLQDATAPVAVRLSIEDSAGLNALVGYRLASFFALELEYEWISEYDIDASVASFPGGSQTIYSLSGHTLTANTRFIIPFWRIQPYLAIGVGFSSWEVKRGPVATALEALDSRIQIEQGRQTNLAGRAGIGVDLYLTENIIFNAQGQVVLTTLKKPGLGNIDDFNYIGFSAGLKYRF